MATFDATLSGSKATSYISLARATELATDTPYAATWAGFSEAQQKSSLNAATGWLETLVYGGTRCGIPSVDDPTKPQSLQWPRSGVTCNGYTAVCSLIPYKIEWAELMLAIQLAQDPNAIIPAPGGGTQAGTYVKREKLGELEREMAEYSSADSSCDNCGDPALISKFPWIEDLLGCWLGASFGSSKILLRVRS